MCKITNIYDYKKRKALQRAGTNCPLRLITAEVDREIESALEHGVCDLCGYVISDLVKINDKWVCRSCLDE